jgi:hypothetical protein
VTLKPEQSANESWPDPYSSKGETDMKSRRSRKLSIAALGGCLIAVALTGCTAVSHVSLGLRSGKIQFAYCEKFSPHKIDIDISPASTSPIRYKNVWMVSGQTAIPRDHATVYGRPPASYKSEVPPAKFDPLTSIIAVTYEGVSGPDAGSNLSGEFDGRRLVEGKWLNWNGHVVDKPC